MDKIFAVITKVPQPGEGAEYDEILVEGWDDCNEEVIYRRIKEGELCSMAETKFVNVKLPAFYLGEILILDPNTGRELVGVQRKPHKWNVEYKEFNDLDEAIECSLKVLEESE